MMQVLDGHGYGGEIGSKFTCAYDLMAPDRVRLGTVLASRRSTGIPGENA